MKPIMAEVMACDFFPRHEWLADDDDTGSCPCCEVVGQGFTIITKQNQKKEHGI